MRDIHTTYNQTEPVKIGNQTIHRQPTYEVKLTDEAWERYQGIESLMTRTASDSGIGIRNLALPTYDRLSRSCLKMSMLLAATRQEPAPSPEGNAIVTCSADDVTNAARYIENWMVYSINMIYNAGKTHSLRTADRVQDFVLNNPGCMHSDIMRAHHLTKREMDEIIGTLVDRGELRVVKRAGKGGGKRYWPT